MLRLAPPRFERILQSPQFSATFGGGEANVAVALAGFGWPAAYVTVLPANHAIADAVIGALRRFDVDASRIVRSKGRMGVYYVETGANQRPSKVLLRPRQRRHCARQAQRYRLGSHARWCRLAPDHRNHALL